MNTIYLDNLSTTRVDPEVFQAMRPFYSDHYGNPASTHHEFGWWAQAAVKKAQRQIALLIGSSEEECFDEIVFTSGATESNHLAILGFVESFSGIPKVVASAIEHSSVLNLLKHLESQSRITLEIVSVDETGKLDLIKLENLLTLDQVDFVSVMGVNNEIGTLQEISTIGSMCRKHEAIFHCDGAQHIGKAPLNVLKDRIDLLTLSGHKIYGPKGIGALFVRKGVQLVPQYYGGGQQRGIRSGTLNVPGIIGLGKACEIAAQRRSQEQKEIELLRHTFLKEMEHLDHVRLLSRDGIPGCISMLIENVVANTLMLELKEYAFSTGSACASESNEPSHVLEAIGIEGANLGSVIRIGIGRFSTQSEVKMAARAVVEKVKEMRGNQQFHPTSDKGLTRKPEFLSREKPSLNPIVRLTT